MTPPKSCRDCAGPVGPRNKSGRCRTCASREACARNNANPACKAKGLATIAKWTPEQRQAKARHLIARIGNMPPDERQRRRERGLELASTSLVRPDVMVKRDAARAAAGRKRSQTTLAGIPEHRWDDYRHLLNYGHMTAAEARRIILDDTPGTVEHARRVVANAGDAMRIKHERDLAARY